MRQIQPSDKHYVVAALCVGFTLLLLMWSYAYPHDSARPELDKWFEGLTSRKGPCCSNADGTALSDVDWESKDGHYRVRIEERWWNVPDDAVLEGPNLSGKTMVWPVYRRWGNGALDVEVRCFLKGSES